MPLKRPGFILRLTPEPPWPPPHHHHHHHHILKKTISTLALLALLLHAIQAQHTAMHDSGK